MIRARILTDALATAQRRRSMCIPDRRPKKEPVDIRPIEDDRDEDDDAEDDDRDLA